MRTTTRNILSQYYVVNAREPASFWWEKKSDSRRHSTKSFSENVVVTEKSYLMLEVLSRRDSEGAYLLQ